MRSHAEARETQRITSEVKITPDDLPQVINYLFQMNYPAAELTGYPSLLRKQESRKTGTGFRLSPE
jgi:uncharacterized tellurite resistance protein B-like protein